ncbi:hypothetical protein B0A53_02581 [Rhodotorula sp. CCFEE 5036]|nr:hypothetical protein B0A53_02581 [Rhodotorula sp. CCFEE 5036]
MRPAYKFPRSQASLDLSEADRAAKNAEAGPSGSVSHPSLLVTDSHGQPTGVDEEQDVVRFSDAAAQVANPAHLSASMFPSKSLSRISEYSESAYSSGWHSRDSQDRTQSPSLSYLYSPKQRASSTASFSFPAPPPEAHLAAAAASSSSSPTPILATAPLAPSPAPVAFRVVNPDERNPDEGLTAPRKHHLPSRPLTTPFPSEGLAPVPVPLDNFAAPPGRERADSPLYGSASGSRPSSPEEYRQNVMVQVPGQAVLSQDPHRYSSHAPAASQSTTQTAWQSAEEDFDAKFDSRSALFNSNGGAYDSAAAFGGISDDYDAYPERGASANRFTLDDDEKVRQRRRQDSDASAVAASNGGQGWDPEREKKGSNKWIWWSLLALLLIGAAVGLGVGLSKKHNNDAAATANGAQRAAAASDSAASAPASSSLTIPTILHPSSATPASFSSVAPSASDSASVSASPTTTPAANDAVETFSTTFGYERGGSTTVVSLTYTIPTSFATRTNGQWQFTEPVVLPNLDGTGSFTSDLRFRVQPTTSPAAAAAAAATQGQQRKRSEAETSGEAGHWKRHHRSRLIR